MAATRKSGKNKNTGGRGRKQTGSASARKSGVQESSIRDEVSLIVVLAAAVLLFLCNFGVIGPVGDGISHILFGIFGLIA